MSRIPPPRERHEHPRYWGALEPLRQVTRRRDRGNLHTSATFPFPYHQPVEFDLLLDPFEASWPDMLAAARAAERSGFAGLWTWDHLAGAVHGQSRVLECWTVLTALAVTVPRVSIGPLVLNVANRPAGTLAVMAATLQHVSGGRLILGLGAGGGPGTPYAAEQEALDRPLNPDTTRRRQVEVAIATMRQVWTGSRKGIGGFLRADPAPPIVVGGFGPKMMALAGRLADGVNLPAADPNLADLIGVARAAHVDAARPEPFLITVFTGFNPGLLRPDNPRLQAWRDLGVHRLILLVRPPYPIDAIAAARLL